MYLLFADVLLSIVGVSVAYVTAFAKSIGYSLACAVALGIVLVSVAAPIIVVHTLIFNFLAYYIAISRIGIRIVAVAITALASLFFGKSVDGIGVSDTVEREIAP